jgi:hypothetical protein
VATSAILSAAGKVPTDISLPSGVSSLPVNVTSGLENVFPSFKNSSGVATSAILTSAGKMPAEASQPSGASYAVNIVNGLSGVLPSFVNSAGTATSAALTATGKIPVDVTSPFAKSGVAESAALDTQNAVYVNGKDPTTGATMPVDIANGLAVELGMDESWVYSIATNSIVLMSTLASGTSIPFWIHMQNTGTNRIQRVKAAGSTATDSTCYLDPGDFLNLYVGTNTPEIGFVGNSANTVVASLGVEIWK